MSEDTTDPTADDPTEESIELLQTAPVTSNYKVLGQLENYQGVGVLGQNDAGSGTPIGVKGTATSSTTSGTPIGVEGTVPNTSVGYGLSTPDDVRVEGTIESPGSHTLSVDGTPTLELGPEGDDGSGTIGGGNVVGGYKDNDAQNVVGATVGGGGNSSTSTVNGVSRDNTNEVTGDYGTVGGGYGNRATRRATIAGGGANTARGADATVGGGLLNTADSIATVGGGSVNDATALRATVAGGLSNTASGEQATVGGGYGNEARAKSATIAGGGDFDSSAPRNVVYDNYGTIGGGDDNQAGTDDGDPLSATYATVGGGSGNTASESSSTVGGGSGNTASGQSSTVCGGGDNTASDSLATVAGGGFGAAESRGSFVWNDGSSYHTIPNSMGDGLSSDKQVSSEPVTGEGTFSVGAQGGVRFITGSSSVTYIDGGSTGWATTSSRATKTNIESVDPQRVLDGIDDLDVATWEYRDEDDGGAGTTHIGPMAEEFHDILDVDVGSSDEHINSINADGVLFAAVQGLSAKLEEKDDRIENLEADRDDLQAETERLRDRIEVLEADRDSKEADNERLHDRLSALEERVAAVEAGTAGSATADD